MGTRKIITWIIGISVAVSACVDDAVTTTTAPTTVPRVSSTLEPETSSAPTTAPIESICLSGDLGFADSGSVARFGSGVGDAQQLSALRWAAHPGCERVVIDLLTAAAAPASEIGDTGVAIIDDTGVIRVSLPRAVVRTGIFDTLFDGELAGRAYVVRLPDGSLAVDIHTAASVPVQVRAFTVDAPARIVVDLSPAAAGGTTVLAPPSRTDRIVVLSPNAGEVSYPLTVTGYARTFEANVIARIYVDGAVASEAFTTATDWLDAWGSFSLTIDSGPSGPVTVFVGEDSAADGRPVGVTIGLMIP